MKITENTTCLVRLLVPLAQWLRAEAARNRRTVPQELATIVESERLRREPIPITHAVVPQEQAETPERIA